MKTLPPLPRTPDGQAWQCPDCPHWASLEDNASWHRDILKHGQPTLIPLEEAKERSLNRPKIVRTVRKPRWTARKMWLHHGGEVSRYSGAVLVDVGGYDGLVRIKPRPVLVTPL